MKIDSVKFVLQAKDMDRAVEFYRDVMGLAVTQHSPTSSILTHRDLTLSLQDGDAKAGPTCLAFEVSDIETACREIKERGGEGLQEPKKFQGKPIVYAEVTDPEGNGFTMSQYAGF